MIIMIILMFLPLIALPVFWFLPAAEAAPIYIVGIILSFWMFWLMRRNKRYRIVTGREGLVGQEADVVSTSVVNGKTAYTILVEGELWTARSIDDVKPGEKVVITAVEGNAPLVQRPSDNAGNII